MDSIKRIIEDASGSIPSDSQTSIAIGKGASPEEVASVATSEGLHERAPVCGELCQH